MAFALVNDGDVGATAIASGVSAVVLSGNATIGNAVLVCIMPLSTNPILSVASSIGTFVFLGRVSGGFYEQEWWICYAAVGAADTVTVTTYAGETWIAQGTQWSGGVKQATYISAVGSSAISMTVNPSATGNVVVVSTAQSSFGIVETNSSPWVDYEWYDNYADAIDVVYQLAVSSANVTATWANFAGTSWLCQAVVLSGSNAPLAATLVAPISSATEDATLGTVFQAVYNSGDGSNAVDYALRCKVAAGSYGYWNGTNFSSATPVWNAIGGGGLAPGGTETVSVPALAYIANGHTYNWSMAFEGDGSLQGPFASDATFLTLAIPAVTVTAPSTTVTTSFPTVTWTDTLGALTQATYRIVIEQGTYSTVPGSGTQRYDSGVVTSTSQSVVIGSPIITNGAARFFVQVVFSNGTTSAWSYATETVTLTAPTAPTISAVSQVGSVGNYPPRIAITSTPHAGFTGTGQLSVLRSDGVYVRGAGWEGTTPITTSPVVVYDYEASLGVNYTYTATIANSSTVQGPFSSASASVSTASNQMVLFDPTNPSGWVTFNLGANWQPKMHEVGQIYYPFGNPYAIKSTDGTKGLGGMITIHTASIADDTAMVALLANMDTLYLGVPARGSWYIFWDPATDRQGSYIYTTLMWAPQNDMQASYWATTRP